MEVISAKDVFPGFYTEEATVHKTSQVLERIYFYDRAAHSTNYGAVLNHAKNGSLVVIDTQGFTHILTESEDLSFTQGLKYVTACSTQGKVSTGYRPDRAIANINTALLDTLDLFH